MPSNNVIEIILEAVDQASSVINGVSKTVQDANDKAADSLSKATDNTEVLEQAFGKLRQAAGALGIAIGAGAIFNKYIDSAGEAEMASVRLELAYKNLGIRTGQTIESLNNFAATIQRTTTFTDEQVAAMQERLFRFGTLTGDTFVRTQRAVVDFAAAMQMDLGGAAQMLGRALEDPSRGMLILRRSGLILSENQKGLIKDFMKAGETAKAQAVILDELDKRFKGTAETVANTLTGSIQQLKIAYDDLFEGTKGGTDAFKVLAQEMTRALQDENIRSGFNAIFGLLAEMTRLVSGAIFGWIQLAGAIKSAFTPSEYSGDLEAAWGQLSAAAGDYTRQLDNLQRARAALNLQAGQAPTAEQMDRQITIRTASGGQWTTTLRDQLRITSELLVKQQQLQAAVATAEARDPAMAAARQAAANQAAAQAAADRAAAAAAAQAETDRKAALARAAALAATKEQAALVEAIRTDYESTLAAINEFTGATKEQLPIFDLQTPGVADPASLINLPALQEDVSAAQRLLDELTAPTFDAIKIDIETSAGWIDPISEDIRNLVIEAENLVKTPVEQLTEKFDNLQAAVRAVMASVPENSEEWNRLDELLTKLGEKQKTEMKALGDTMGEYAKQAARNMQDAFARFLFDPFKGGVRGMLRSFIDAIRQMVANIIAVKVFEKLGIASLLGLPIGGSAGGGIIPANKPRIVGEEGPELILPTAQSSVFNARQLAFGAAGGSKSVDYRPSNTIVINGRADTDTQAQLAAMMQANNEAQLKYINQMLYSNGFGRMR